MLLGIYSFKSLWLPWGQKVRGGGWGRGEGKGEGEGGREGGEGEGGKGGRGKGGGRSSREEREEGNMVMNIDWKPVKCQSLYMHIISFNLTTQVYHPHF